MPSVNVNICWYGILTKSGSVQSIMMSTGDVVFGRVGNLSVKPG